ncbi:hypothetical protein FOA52_007128 [Chlamydomonas sp. UWO 241]|nr:hypothetical protein FOA52_007128 [Chlamydomonas sp. UWO 241]
MMRLSRPTAELGDGIVGLLRNRSVSHPTGDPVRIDDIVCVGDRLIAMVIKNPGNRSLKLLTRELEQTPGDMLRDPQLLFDKAEQMADVWRARGEAAWIRSEIDGCESTEQLASLAEQHRQAFDPSGARAALSLAVKLAAAAMPRGITEQLLQLAQEQLPQMAATGLIGMLNVLAKLGHADNTSAFMAALLEAAVPMVHELEPRQLAQVLKAPAKLELGGAAVVAALRRLEEAAQAGQRPAQEAAPPPTADFQGFKVGDLVEGSVQSVQPYGVFLELGNGAVGLLHISRISHEPITDIGEIFSKGDRVKVLVLAIDQERGRLTLSTTQLEPTPGDMLRDPQLVFGKAEETAAAFQQGAASRGGESSGLLNITIKLKDTEVVKRATAKGFEVIEFGGAVFYRKRKAPVEASPCKRGPATDTPVEGEGAQGGGSWGSDSLDSVPEAGCAGVGSPMAEMGSLQLPMRTPCASGSSMRSGSKGLPLPMLSPAAAAASRAGPIPLPVLQQQLQGCLPPSCPKAIALEFAVEQLLTHGARELDRAHDTHVYSGAARKLVGRLASLLQGQVEGASALLLRVGPARVMSAAQATSSDTPPTGNAASAAAAAASNAATPAPTPSRAPAAGRSSPLAARTPVPGLTPSQPSPSPATAPPAGAAAPSSAADESHQLLSRYMAHAPMVRELSQGALLQATLSQQLAALKAEEAAWAGVRERARQAPPQTQPSAAATAPAPSNDAAAATAGPNTAAPTEAASPAKPAAGPPAGACSPSAASGAAALSTPTPAAAAAAAVGPAASSVLADTEAGVNAELAVQVEWLGGFLSKVDALVSRGDEACMLLQADYHADKFRTFPHVNSPGWLIDQIVSKQPS